MPTTKKETIPAKTATQETESVVKTVMVKDSKPKVTKSVKQTELSVPIYSLVGEKTAATLELPKELFGADVNTALLAQAIRIYSNNQKSHNSNTKTRGEVMGSTRKIYRQKGTGRARHGGITAPIFVGGGIALGPKSRKVVLDLPKKMKLAALVSSLSQRAKENAITGLNLEKVSGKTKEIATLMKKLDERISSSNKQSFSTNKKSVLIVGDDKTMQAGKASQNLKGVTFKPASQINVYEIIRHKNMLITKDAVELLQQRFAQKGEITDAKS